MLLYMYLFKHSIAFYVGARYRICEKRLFVSSCLSVCPLGTYRLPLEGFFMESNT